MALRLLIDAVSEITHHTSRTRKAATMTTLEKSMQDRNLDAVKVLRRLNHTDRQQSDAVRRGVEEAKRSASGKYTVEHLTEVLKRVRKS